MPIYEFKCVHCGHIFEKLVKPDVKLIEKINSGEIWPLCEACFGRTKKVISPSNFKVNGHNAANGYAKGTS